MEMARVLSLLIGYIFGLFITGYIFGKKKDVDIRKKGSGNVGTTNTIRILGLKVGTFTLVGDCLKCILAVLFVWCLFHNKYPDQVSLLQLYAAIGAILGHDFPFYLKFKGGKGIATSFGMIVALFPWCLPICFVAFALAVGITRFVSLGSILAALALLVQTWVFGAMGWMPYGDEYLLEAQILISMVCLLAIVLHHANINRLIHGNENKFSFKSKRD